MSNVYVIAEAGVNHNGDLELARRLVDCAAEAGADAVKFQTFRAEDVVTPGAATADYQRANTGATSQFDMIKALELDEAGHAEVAAHCARIGIEFFSTPFSEPAVDLLVRLGVRRIKMPSGEITNKPLLQHAAATGLPLLMSSGMATLDEVKRAVEWLREARRAAGHGEFGPGELSLFHCTSAYPAPPEALNLTAIPAMQRDLGVAIGYSDHSEGIEAALAAVALGATVIEKHITVDRTLPGPDHSASLEPGEFTQMVTGIRRVTAMRGDGAKAPTPAERDTARVARRSVAAACDIPAGAQITEAMLVCRRPATGIAPRDIGLVVGARAREAIAAMTVLQWEQLERGDGA